MFRSFMGYAIPICAFVLFAASSGYSETAYPPAALTLPAPQSLEIRAQVSGSGVPAHPSPAAPQAVIVVETPRTLTLDGLRRDASLYPDHDLAGRFVELTTQLPPLFGEDD